MRDIARWIGCAGLATLLLLLPGSGCRRTRVRRLDADTAHDLSGRWNDTDSRLTAEAMIRQLMEDGIFVRYQRVHGRRPVVVVGAMRNETDEHIAIGTFIKDIERNLVESGDLRLVAGPDERPVLREERLDQQAYASEETARRLAAETGADLMLTGSLHVLTDAVEGRQVRLFQVVLELLDLESNEKLWLGESRIRKLIRQRRATW